jgi:hypothetical protein
VTDQQRLPGVIRDDCPCHGCTERFLACSDRCPKDERGEYGYKAWKATLNKVKQAEREYMKNRREDYQRSEVKEVNLQKYIRGKTRGK